MDWIVPSDEAGKKLITFLSERLGGDSYSARHLKRLIEGNLCKLNGKTERFASTILAKGDHLTLHIEEAASSVKLQFESSRVLYEDHDLLIYDKPPGVNCDAKGILQLLKPQYASIYLIHRLDRETSGVLLLGKNSKIVELMIQEFKNLRVRKEYLAIVDGSIDKKEGSIDNYLGKKHVYQGQTMWGPVSEEKGLHAHTDWKRMIIGSKATLVQCFPLTGRTHQLRVHLSGIGHPILGDFQYCKKFRCPYRPPRILLHASRIQFIHPMTKVQVEVESPLPDDFTEAKRRLL